MRLRFRTDGPIEDLFEKLDDTQLTLIVIGQAPRPEGLRHLGELLCTYVVPTDVINDAELARVHIPRPSFYLLRPDGHVGLCGVHVDAGAIKSYVSERLGLKVRPERGRTLQ